MRFLDPDSNLYTALNRFCDLVFLSFFWTVCSLPVVTIGASSAALYRAAVESFRYDEGSTVSDFFHYFKQNVKQSIPLSLICVFWAAFVVVAYIFSRSLGIRTPFGFLYLILSVLAAFLLVSSMMWMFPVLSRFEMKTLEICKIGLLFSAGDILPTILMDIVFALFCWGVYAVPALIFFLPCSFALFCSIFVEPYLNKVLKARDLAEKKKTEKKQSPGEKELPEDRT